jgi:hypothetical protein
MLATLPRMVDADTVSTILAAPVAVACGFPSPAHCVRLNTVQRAGSGAAGVVERLLVRSHGECRSLTKAVGLSHGSVGISRTASDEARPVRCDG